MTATENLPTKMKAVKTVEQGKVALVYDAPLPVIGEDEVLVKCMAAAQNPIDWQCVHWPGFIYPGHTNGCDFSGLVVSSNSPLFHVGDRVAGLTHGNFGPSPDNGSFGEYVRASASSTLKIPDGMSWEGASTLPLAIATIGQVFWGAGGLGLPKQGETQVEGGLLVYGGSTCMGATAVQVAKAAGVAPIVAVCGAKNIDFVKSLGADVVLDRLDPEVVQKIKAATGDKLAKAFDPVARENSTDIVTAAMSPAGGVAHCTHILDASKWRADVQLPFRIVFNLLGKSYGLAGMEFAKEADAPEFVAGVFRDAEKLVAAGKLKPHPTKVLAGGLVAVEEGLEMGRNWQLSAEKIVYRVEDTPATPST